MANRNKMLNAEETKEAMMTLDGTFDKEARQAEWAYSEEELLDERISKVWANVEYDLSSDVYYDKRLVGDMHPRKYVVFGVDGDTETHYVNPVCAVAEFSTKHKAMEHIRKCVKEVIRKRPKMWIKERFVHPDHFELRLDGQGEILFVMQAVVVNGAMDLSKL